MFSEAEQNRQVGDRKGDGKRERIMASCRGHLAHGYTWKLNRKVMACFVLTTAPKGKKISAVLADCE